MENKPPIYLHGECTILKIDELPPDVNKITLENPKEYVIALSEVTGNDHFVNVKDGVSILTDNKGRRFMSNTVPTSVQCRLGDARHHTIDLEPGYWLFGVQQGYDYVTRSKQAIKD